MATRHRRGAKGLMLGALLLALLGGCGPDQGTLAFDLPDFADADAGSMALRSPAFGQGQRIPLRHSAYGDDVSPPLAWEPVAGARSYALVMEDPDADRPAAYVHWVAWNIPATVTSLPEALPTDAQPATPEGMRQGLNDRGTAGYFGPRPPAGTGVHHYHLQLFALDAALDIDPASGRRELLEAMRGHVIARARLVGTYPAPGTPES